jgi:hypothetical protein
MAGVAATAMPLSSSQAVSSAALLPILKGFSLRKHIRFLSEHRFADIVAPSYLVYAKKEGVIETARNMLGKGMVPSLAASCTNLSLEAAEALR